MVTVEDGETDTHTHTQTLIVNVPTTKLYPDNQLLERQVRLVLAMSNICMMRSRNFCMQIESLSLFVGAVHFLLFFFGFLFGKRSSNF